MPSFCNSCKWQLLKIYCRYWLYCQYSMDKPPHYSHIFYNYFSLFFIIFHYFWLFFLLLLMLAVGGFRFLCKNLLLVTLAKDLWWISLFSFIFYIVFFIFLVYLSYLNYLNCLLSLHASYNTYNSPIFHIFT